MIMDTLRALCALDGVSGGEQSVSDWIENQFRDRQAPVDITRDAVGNLLVHVRGKEPAKSRLMFDAHTDEVGLIITHIEENGTLLFETVGGIDKQVLFGHCVRFDKVLGLIAGKAVHHCKSEEKNRIPDLDTLTVDIGASSRSEAERLVSIGQTGTFVSEFTTMQNGLFKAKAIDNRVGCAILLELACKPQPRDFWISFSTQEEIGLRGAKTATYQIHPQIAVVLDATTAADVAGTPEEKVVCRVGQGAVVSFMDKATLYDPELYHQIRTIADECGIPTQTKTTVTGGNNAGAVQRSLGGVRTAAVSLPCRYIHSPSGVAKESDVQAMEQLVHELAVRLTV